jgi:Putative beta barrel porin-7 (BBP7)
MDSFMRCTWFAIGLLVVGVSTANALAQEGPPIPTQGRNAQPPFVPSRGGQAILSEAGDPLQPLQVNNMQAVPDRSRIYGGVEYLNWWMKKGNFPALVTNGDPADAPPGALGQPGTNVLYGDRVGPNGFSGARLNLGLWLDAEQTWALEGNYFLFGQRHVNFSTGHSGDPSATTTLNVPFFNADTGLEDALQIGVPGGQSGAITVVTAHRFDGAELNLRTRLAQGNDYRVFLIGGFRYLSLVESLDLSAYSDALAPPVGGPGSFADRFATSNRYYGGQVGIGGEFTHEEWVLNLHGKLGFGSMTQKVSINGSTTAIDPITGTMTTTPGGFFAAPSNTGDYSRTRFAFVPEIGVNLGYRLTPNVTATVGYTFLYISSVVRPSDQIDRSVNIAPPNTHPAFSFQSTDFWTQGVNLGLEIRF